MSAACVLEDERRVAELADQSWPRGERRPSTAERGRHGGPGRQSWPEAPVSVRDRPKWPRDC